MSVMETDVASPVIDTTDGDHEKMAHIVTPASAVTEAYLTGAPVQALCGKMWVPTRDPARYGVCPTCIEVFERGSGKRWEGPR